jgi:hypothetical protein
MINRFIIFCYCLTFGQAFFAQNILPKQGSVGVGTMQPKGSLDVKGVTYLERLLLGDVTNPTASLFQLGVPNQFADSTVFKIAQPNRTLFQISKDGVVRSREIIVDNADNWPDYVFDNSYQLRSLEELKGYIQSQKHLPNVPSAEQIQSDGLAVGEMNRLLLEKIEELTLYILQQEERIRCLEENQR